MAASAVIARDFTSELAALLDEAISVFDEVAGVTIDWNSIKWSKQGPSALFEQFRIAGGWADFILNKVFFLEQKRNKIISDFSNFKILIEKRMEGALKTGGKRLITEGYAYQERVTMARIEVGDAIWDEAVFDKRLESLNSALSIIKAKAKQFTDFKADARVAVSMLNFGHSIGELM
jgi:hypothetical protein